MNIKRLRELISELPDDVEVVVEGDDHSYVPIEEASYVDAEKHKRKFWQYFDQEHMSEGSTCVKVLRLG